MKALVAAGISELVIVVGFKQELIRSHLAKMNYPLRITYVENPQVEGTGPILGGFANILEHLVGPFVFFHCDVLFTAEALRRVLDDAHGSVMLYCPGIWDEEAGKIIVGADDRVTECGKHIDEGRSTGEYLQLAKFDENFAGHIRTTVETRKAEGRDGFTIDAFNDALQDGALAYGLPYEGMVTEIDTPEDYHGATAAWDTR